MEAQQLQTPLFLTCTACSRRLVEHVVYIVFSSQLRMCVDCAIHTCRGGAWGVAAAPPLAPHPVVTRVDNVPAAQQALAPQTAVNNITSAPSTPAQPAKSTRAPPGAPKKAPAPAKTSVKRVLISEPEHDVPIQPSNEGGEGGTAPPAALYEPEGRVHQMFRAALGRGAVEQSIRNILPMLREAHFQPHPTVWGAWFFGPLTPDKKWHNMWRFFTSKMMVHPDLHDLTLIAGSNKTLTKGPKDLKLAWTFKIFAHTVAAAQADMPEMPIPDVLRERVAAAREELARRATPAARSSSKPPRPRNARVGSKSAHVSPSPSSPSGDDDSAEKDEIEDDSSNDDDSDDSDDEANDNPTIEDDDGDDGDDKEFADMIIPDKKPQEPEPKRAKLSTTQ